MTSNMAATFSTTVTIPEPKIGGGGPHGPGTRPPGGGGDGGSGESLPDYGARLRRYRLGLGAGLISVTMIFVSLTSAYIVRQGLGSWDDAANAYVLDWKPVNIPTVLLLINTAILLASSFTMEMARRRLARQAALAPVLLAMTASAQEAPKPGPEHELLKKREGSWDTLRKAYTRVSLTDIVAFPTDPIGPPGPPIPVGKGVLVSN